MALHQFASDLIKREFSANLQYISNKERLVKAQEQGNPIRVSMLNGMTILNFFRRNSCLYSSTTSIPCVYNSCPYSWQHYLVPCFFNEIFVQPIRLQRHNVSVVRIKLSEMWFQHYECSHAFVTRGLYRRIKALTKPEELANKTMVHMDCF